MIKYYALYKIADISTYELRLLAKGFISETEAEREVKKWGVTYYVILPYCEQTYP